MQLLFDKTWMVNDAEEVSVEDQHYRNATVTSSGEDRTAIALFIAGVRGWGVELQRAIFEKPSSELQS